MPTWDNSSFFDKLTSLNRIKLTSKCCNSSVSVNEDKLIVVFGGGIGLMIVSAFVGLGSGWIALITALGSGDRMAKILLRAKVDLLKKSSNMGAFFYCSKCNKEVSVVEIFTQVGKYLGIDL